MNSPTGSVPRTGQLVSPVGITALDVEAPSPREPGAVRCFDSHHEQAGGSRQPG
jgi:hypothetical protein